MKTNLLTAMLLGTLFLGWTAPAAYLESDFEPAAKERQHEPPPEPPRPIPPRPILPPVRENEVAQLIRRLRVGRPFQHRGVAVYPLTLSHNQDQRRYLTFDEAVRGGQLEVHETGSVRVALMVNRSASRVFLLAGELLIGGKQNRMLSADAIIPPRSEVRVGVYCIEKDRWRGDKRRFESRDSICLPSMRQHAGRGASQEEVWASVASNAAKLEVQSKTRDFQQLYESEAVRRRLDEYRKVFRGPWPRRTVGYVFCRYGRIIGAEIFGGDTLFSRLRHKLLDSYVLDHLAGPPDRSRSVAPNVPRYLQQALRARVAYGETPGEGRALSLTGAASGRGLAAAGAVVHLQLDGAVVIIHHRQAE